MKYLSGFAYRWATGLAFLSLALMAISPLYFSSPAKAASSAPRVGGACEYKTYPGEAKIESISQKNGTSAEYDVQFSFFPNQPVKEDFAKTDKKTWTLLTKDFNAPGKNFLEKNDLKPGKRIPGKMKVIVRGTCTPILFDFPTLNDGKTP